MPGNSWYYLCIATWWPMDEEKCSEDARCAVCTTSIMAAYSACEKFNQVNHKCLQKVRITINKSDIVKVSLAYFFFYMFMTNR